MDPPEIPNVCTSISGTLYCRHVGVVSLTMELIQRRRMDLAMLNPQQTKMLQSKMLQTKRYLISAGSD